MKRIWRFYRRRIDLYLLLGFVGFTFVSLVFKLDYLIFFFGLLALIISPGIFYLISRLLLQNALANKRKERQNSIRIPTRCLQCRWYYGKVDRRYRFLCLVSSHLQKNCVDFQS